MSSERANRSEWTPEMDDSPWGEAYQKDLPSFNPERREDDESDRSEVSERDIAIRMLDLSDERQDEYSDWLNQINQGNLHGDAINEYNKYLDEQYLIDGPDALARWQEELESSLKTLQKQDELVIKGLEDLERPENAGKTIDEIFADKAEESRKRIDSLVASGAWDGRLNDAQRNMYLQNRDGFQDLAEWAPFLRSALKQEADGGITREIVQDVLEDESQSETLLDVKEKQSLLGNVNLKRIVQGAQIAVAATENDYYQYLKRVARKEAIPYEELLSGVREAIKESRFGKNKDRVKFYHSTSMDNLSDILSSGGELLSRSKRREQGEDISGLPWSSSENIQFSCDSFDEKGELIQSGYGAGRGASGGEISFVFGKDLIDEETFDAASSYPTVEAVGLSEKCLGIIVKDSSKVETVRDLLKRYNMKIPVYAADSYDPKSTSRELWEEKTRLSETNTTEGDDGEQALEDEPRLDIKPKIESDDLFDSGERGEASAETEVEDEKMSQSSKERPAANSEAELQAVRGAIESIHLETEQLFAMAKGSLSMEQAAGYLLISNQQMVSLTDEHIEVLKGVRSVEQVKLQTGAYDEQMKRAYGSSMNAIKVIRDKAQVLPTVLKGPIFRYCQKIENTLAAVMSTVTYEDGKIHSTPVEKQNADEEELGNIVKEEMLM